MDSLPQCPPRYSVAVAIEAPNGGLSQVFYDEGRGFNEADQSSIIIQHTAETKTYRYLIPSGKLSAVRYDFPDGAGEYLIHSVTLLDDAGNPVRDIPVRAFSETNDIASITPRADGIAVTVAAGRPDPYMIEPLTEPFIIPGLAHRFIAIGAAVAVGAAILRRVTCGVAHRAGTRGTDAGVARAPSAIRLSIPHFLPLDHVAVAYYLAILLYFFILSAAGIHGSSISIMSTNFAQDHASITQRLGSRAASGWMNGTPTRHCRF